AAFKRAVAADPDFALARYQLAYTTWAADGSDEALPELVRNAVALSARLPAQDQGRLEAFGLFVDGRNAEAERRCRDLIRGHPDDVEPRVLLGEILVHTGDRRG